MGLDHFQVLPRSNERLDGLGVIGPIASTDATWFASGGATEEELLVIFTGVRIRQG
jgi:hypothetical protein